MRSTESFMFVLRLEHWSQGSVDVMKSKTESMELLDWNDAHTGSPWARASHG